MVVMISAQVRKCTALPNTFKLQYLLKNISVRSRATILQNFSPARLDVGRIRLYSRYSMIKPIPHNPKEMTDSITELMK